MTKQEEHIAVTQKQEDSSLAIVSMVLGVVSLTGPGLLLGIPAIVTGIIAIRKKVTNRSLAITGLITGIVSTVLSLLFCIFLTFVILWGINHPEEFDNSPQNGASQQRDDIPFDQSRT